MTDMTGRELERACAQALEEGLQAAALDRDNRQDHARATRAIRAVYERLPGDRKLGLREGMVLGKAAVAALRSIVTTPDNPTLRQRIQASLDSADRSMQRPYEMSRNDYYGALTDAALSVVGPELDRIRVERDTAEASVAYLHQWAENTREWFPREIGDGWDALSEAIGTLVWLHAEAKWELREALAETQQTKKFWENLHHQNEQHYTYTVLPHTAKLEDQVDLLLWLHAEAQWHWGLCVRAIDRLREAAGDGCYSTTEAVMAIEEDRAALAEARAEVARLSSGDTPTPADVIEQGWEITVTAFELAPGQRERLFDAVSDAAHAFDDIPSVTVCADSFPAPADEPTEETP